jgi:hypothetical protein
MDFLDRKRMEIERGAGGDHDIPYHFTLPIFMPQQLEHFLITEPRQL